MKSYTRWDWLQLAGAACFVAGTAALRFGFLSTALSIALAALGLLAIGAGWLAKGRQ